MSNDYFLHVDLAASPTSPHELSRGEIFGVYRSPQVDDHWSNLFSDDRASDVLLSAQLQSRAMIDQIALRYSSIDLIST
jgi:hypothetical protein